MKPTVGSIGWVDLTVEDADGVRDFYSEVTGWTPEPLDMGEYNDYVMKAAPGEGEEAGPGVAGVCHARGSNQGLPAQWLIYVTVANLAESLERCRALGGEVISPVRDMGAYGTMAVIRDPAGAVAALIEPAAETEAG